MVWHHMKVVHHIEAPKKTVLCRPGEEVYFPSADEFDHDWDDFVSDEHRGGPAWDSHDAYTAEFDHKNTQQALRIGARYPGHQLVQYWKPLPFEYSTTVFPVAPRLIRGLNVDVAVAARRRVKGAMRNFRHWADVVEQLRSMGLTVGVVGTKETTFPVDADIYSWDYDDLGSATLELLQNCRVYIGGDTGVSHLAAFCQTPMICFRTGQGYGMMFPMHNMNESYCKCYHLTTGLGGLNRRQRLAEHPMGTPEEAVEFIVNRTVDGLKFLNK